MSPNTPYNGMLLYHGVGVGKTCTAILTAEAFLHLSPKNKVYILAPPAIQDGFYRTIFDIHRVKLGKETDDLNQHDGCTGNLYLELTQTQFERETKDIEYRVNRLINKRYSIMGYVAFRNMIREILDQIPKNLSPEKKIILKAKLLQKNLSGSLFIVDEAHNLRTVGDDIEDESDTVDDPESSKSDASAGKKLTPFLKEVLRICDGIKLLLMTATPMYNTYREIINLLDLLLIVDKVDESQKIKDSDLQFTATGQLTPESESKIIHIANSRVSYMRGENPKAFPARLNPPDTLRVTEWPSFQPNGKVPVNSFEKENAMRLPLVKCELADEALAVLDYETKRLIALKGTGIRTIDTLLQAGNCIFPGEGLDDRIGSTGFSSWFAARSIAATFEGTKLSTLPQYAPTNADNEYGWMENSPTALKRYSPKFFNVLQSIQTSVGISFVYSRFVENGAIILCLLLEANGYSPWGRSARLFSKGPVSAGGRQCARCSKREVGHSGDHTFTPAYYALLTASDVKTIDKQSLPLSPNNTRVIQAARNESNADGSKIKVIVGSQVAGEGLDLKAIRDVHILEGWFHLSKEEQIIGRGIRYCSHQALPKEQRNCTIHLYVNTFPLETNRESIDLYSYRTAMNKAVRVGNVSRALKRGAADCNLNHELILVNGLTSVQMVNSQKNPITVDLNDKDYTPICDWIQCSYQCNPEINVLKLKEDTSTYDLFAARFMEQSLISNLKKMFKTQVLWHWDDLQNIFSEIPKQTLVSLLLRSVNNPSVVLENGDWQGHLIIRNNLFLFQPTSIRDQSIPLALRYGKYPVKRDYYQPILSSVVNTSTTTTNTTVPRPIAAAPPVDVDTVFLVNFWTQLNRWIDDFKAPMVETVPKELVSLLLTLANKDVDKRDNLEQRLKRLQWWGKSILMMNGDLSDLQTVARQFVWDNFLNVDQQLALYTSDESYIEIVADPEYQATSGSGSKRVTAYRYLKIDTKSVVYLCNPSTKTVCSPAEIQAYTSSKTDIVITAVADQTTTGELYGALVPWENGLMFKSYKPVKKGKEPSGGSACVISSTVSAHKKKLIELGLILARYTGGSHFDLLDDTFKKGAPRNLSGASNLCTLMEIILRWMDLRKQYYGNLRYFYRPISAFYSKHTSIK